MIHRQPLQRSDPGGRKPQVTVLGSLTVRPGPSQTCLMQRTDA